MNELEKAVAILVCIKHGYPAVFRAFELDKALEHLVNHSQTTADVLTPFLEAMSENERARFAAANPMLPGGATSFTITLPMTTKVNKE